MASETSPLLLLSLSIRRQRRQRERDRDENDDGDGQPRQEQSSPQQQQQQQQQHQEQQQQQHQEQQQQQQQPTLARSFSLLSRRRSSSPLLPVIHEENDDRGEHSSSRYSGSASGGDLWSSFGSGHTSSASSSLYNALNNLNSMSGRVVWPPEDDDGNGTSWPPRNSSSSSSSNSSDDDGRGGQGVDYGSLVNDDYISSSSTSTSSSPSDDASSGSPWDAVRASHGRRRHRHHRTTTTPFYSKRNRYLRSVLVAIFAVTLSAVVWMPLFQEEEEQPSSSSSSSSDSEQKNDDDHNSTLRRGNHNAWWGDDSDWSSEDDDVAATSFGSSSAAAAAVAAAGRPQAAYRHRRFFGGDDHGESSSSPSEAPHNDENYVRDDDGDSIDFSKRLGSPPPPPLPLPPPSSIPANISFADLAALMLPPYFQRTVDLCASTILPATTKVGSSSSVVVVDRTASPPNEAQENHGNTTTTSMKTTSAMPGEVYSLRKTMLMTRDLFDVFSPVYSRHSSLEDYISGGSSSSSSSGMRHIVSGYGERQFELTLESDHAYGTRRKEEKKVNYDDDDDDGDGGGDGNDGDKESPSVVIKDLWKTLRHFLAEGYRLIGDFQDLDHAHVTYTNEQLAQYQMLVWMWHEEFMKFVGENRHHISLYLSLPCTTRHPAMRKHKKSCRHVHSHSSHLFWGDMGATTTTGGNDDGREGLPDGNLDGAASALRRLGISQLERARTYLGRAATYERVFFSSPPGPAAGIDAEEEEDEDEDNGAMHHEVYHNLRKELRSFLDEVTLFGELMIPDSSSSSIPEISKDGEERDDGGGPALDRTPPSSPEQELTDEALLALKRCRKLLGDLNDDYVAHSMYLEWDEFPDKRLRLKEAVEARWSEFRIWAMEVDLPAKMEFLVAKLKQASIREEAAQVPTSDEMYIQDGLSNPTYDLEAFLVQRKENPTIHFVIGNDAGDADSIISAISLAYIESMHSDAGMTPIVSISKDAFSFERPSVNLLFQIAGISDPSDKLLFIEDLTEMLEIDSREGMPIRSISLVDHNTLNNSLRPFQNNVVVTDIVDHHEDQREHEGTCTGDRRNIAFENGHALVASATTLVAERLQTYYSHYPSSLATLLLGVILLDSVNLEESVGKVTQRDRDAVSALLLRTNWYGIVPPAYLKKDYHKGMMVDTDVLFEKLQGAKYNPAFWDSLSVERALGYDYKVFHHRGAKFGISSILMPGLDFMSKEGFCDSTSAFMELNQISGTFLAIMFAFYDGGIFCRQLAFVSVDRTVSLSELVGAMTTYKSVDLQLEEIQLPSRIGSSENVRLFDQNNVSPSRKQIGPMLENI